VVREAAALALEEEEVRRSALAVRGGFGAGRGVRDLTVPDGSDPRRGTVRNRGRLVNHWLRASRRARRSA
jgi:hypothetical protein